MTERSTVDWRDIIFRVIYTDLGLITCVYVECSHTVVCLSIHVYVYERPDVILTNNNFCLPSH